MPLMWLDIILIIIMLISAFLAMLRGLTREMLSIMSLALAVLAALLAYIMFHDSAEDMAGSKTIGAGLLVGLVFTVVFVVITIVTLRLSDRILDSRVGAIDRTLGFVFGLLRGLVIVVIAYELAVHFWQKDTMPAWVKEARTLPVIESTGSVLLGWLPDNPAGWFQKKGVDNAPPLDVKTFAAASHGFVAVRQRRDGSFYAEVIRREVS